MRKYKMKTIVKSMQGHLECVEEEGVQVFRGVPFAAPPTGPLRFCSPVPPEHWEGIRKAERSGPSSWQMNADNLEKIQGLIRELGDHFPGIRPSPPFAGITYLQPTISEDCLYLNIWVPEHAPGERLPVYLYYHGGGNAGSAGSLHLERGARLAREERVIVVRPNYRMGALGWVHFGLLSDDLPEALNLGVQDQIAALRWVAENIERFGGDPDNITVGGESAGATAVSHLLVNPEARKLLRRAILQSFTPYHQWATQKRQDGVAIAEIYLQLLRIADPRDLLSIDPDRLIAVSLSLQRFFHADKNCAWRPLGAVVDGLVIPEQPATYLATADLGSPALDVMIGLAKDEWQFFLGHTEMLKTGTEEDFIRIMSEACGQANSMNLLTMYKRIYPDRIAPQLISDAMSFEFFKMPGLRIAANLARQDVRTRVFQFSYDLPGQGGYLRASHTCDMPFIWRNYGPEDLGRWPAFEGINVDTLKCSASRFGAMYGSFIRTGDPGPNWPCYDERDQTILWFGEDVEARSRVLSDELTAFERCDMADIAVLEDRLVQNVREALNVSARALAGSQQ
jgi:para-nitrobenzyl esterase